MAKLRVYELAKELGVNTKDLMNVLKELGADVKTNFSTLEDSIISSAKDMLKQRDVRVKDEGSRHRPRPVHRCALRPRWSPHRRLSRPFEVV